MKLTRDLISDILIISGILCISSGVFIISIPYGLMITGLLLIGCAIAIAKGGV